MFKTQNSHPVTVSVAHCPYSVTFPWSKFLQLRDYALCWAHRRSLKKENNDNMAKGMWSWADWQNALIFVKRWNQQSCFPDILMNVIVGKWAGIVQISSDLMNLAIVLLGFFNICIYLPVYFSVLLDRHCKYYSQSYKCFIYIFFIITCGYLITKEPTKIFL